VSYFLPRTELNHESELFRTNNQCIVQELGASGKSRVTHGFCDPGAVGSASSILGVGAVVLSRAPPPSLVTMSPFPVASAVFVLVAVVAGDDE
jgi:hypothetical protein